MVGIMLPHADLSGIQDRSIEYTNLSCQCCVIIGEYKPIKIMLLAGGDLVQSFAAPDVWATADVCPVLFYHARFFHSIQPS